MKFAITGHRPDKLGSRDDLLDALSNTFIVAGPEYIYEGQAPGADLLAAFAAYNVGIPYEAVIPYAGHRSMMKTDYWRQMWDAATQYADRVETLSDSINYPGHWCMFNRNHYMVDHADEVLAVFDGNFGRGGTQETVTYAIKRGKPVHVINPVTLEFTRAAY